MLFRDASISIHVFLVGTRQFFHRILYNYVEILPVVDISRFITYIETLST